MKKGANNKMVRTVVYVFGPKSGYSHYMNDTPHNNELDSWIKIGEAHSDDFTTDKMEIAMNRIKQEVHTGIPYTCRLYDAFEYPYRSHTDDIIRDIMSEELFGLSTSKASNKLIVDPFEIKAGREFVYGATRKHVKNSLARFEHDLFVGHMELDDFETVKGFIKSNSSEFDSPSEDDSPTTKGFLDNNSFWESVIKRLPSRIQATHPKNKSYLTAKTSRSGFWYAANYRVRFNDAYVALETYGGEKARQSVNDYIKEKGINIHLEEKQGVNNKEKWGWYFSTNLDKTENELRDWFVESITLVYDQLEQ